MKRIVSIFCLLASLLVTGCDHYDIHVITSTPKYNGGAFVPSIDNGSCNINYTYKNNGTPKVLNEQSSYFQYNDVALYIVSFQKLPQNYVTKDMYEQDKGKYGNKNYNIGGDRFSNYQHILPNESVYIECDVNTQGTSGSVRGTDRIVYSRYNYRVFYTQDHYDSFQEYLGYNNWGPSFHLIGSVTTYQTPCYVG